MQRPRRGRGKSGGRRPAGQAVLPRLSPRMAPMAARTALASPGTPKSTAHPQKNAFLF